MRDYLNKYASTQSPGVRNASGIAYIIIKTKNGKPRADYIKDCILKSCVTIAFENGGFLENVPVSKHLWNYIEFPEKEDKLGSCVVWNNIDKRNSVVITAVIPKINEINNISENQFLISRGLNDKHIEIAGDAKSGKINISVDGGESDGELMINVFNKSKTANLSVNVQGKVTLDIADDVQINSKTKVILGKNKNGSEGITLGKKAEEVINAFIDEVAKATVTTALGTMPLLNTAQISLLKKNTSKIISQYSFTD
jgi:hypothetical protein